MKGKLIKKLTTFISKLTILESSYSLLRLHDSKTTTYSFSSGKLRKIMNMNKADSAKIITIFSKDHLVCPRFVKLPFSSAILFPIRYMQYMLAHV